MPNLCDNPTFLIAVAISTLLLLGVIVLTKKKTVAFIFVGLLAALMYFFFSAQRKCHDQSRTPVSGDITVTEEDDKKIYSTLLDEYSKLGQINDSLHKEVQSLKGLVDFYVSVGVIKRIDTVFVEVPTVIKLPVSMINDSTYHQRYTYPYFYTSESFKLGGRVSNSFYWSKDSSDMKIDSFSVDSLVIQSDILIGTRKIKNYYEIFAYSNDPTISFNKLKGARLKRPSKLNIGIYGGLGIGPQGFGPQIGVGATYNLIPLK